MVRKARGLTQKALAGLVDFSLIQIHRYEAVTPDTALRLERVLRMPADFWLTLQQDWDLWHAMRSRAGRAVRRLRPLRRVTAA